MYYFATLAKTTCGFILTIVAATGAQGRDFEMGGDSQFPYSIMAPEPASHHRAAAPHHGGRIGAAHAAGEQSRGSDFYAARSTPGVVLPTPLPRTRLIPPEGGMVTPHPLPRQQGPTFVPGAPSLGAVPNLPHGNETFQDRASRCSFQQGLYGVPATAGSQYMGACLQ